MTSFSKTFGYYGNLPNEIAQVSSCLIANNEHQFTRHPMTCDEHPSYTTSDGVRTMNTELHDV